MLKNSQTRPQAIDDEQALGIGVKAVEFLATEPELLSRFLDLSGLSVEQLRREAQRPAFFAGLLDFILDHEPTLTSFAARCGMDPLQIVAARGHLARSPRPAAS